MTESVALRAAGRVVKIKPIAFNDWSAAHIDTDKYLSAGRQSAKIERVYSVGHVVLTDNPQTYKMFGAGSAARARIVPSTRDVPELRPPLQQAAPVKQKGRIPIGAVTRIVRPRPRGLAHAHQSPWSVLLRSSRRGAGGGTQAAPPAARNAPQRLTCGNRCAARSIPLRHSYRSHTPSRVETASRRGSSVGTHGGWGRATA